MFVTLLISGLCLGAMYGIVALGYSLIYKASNMVTFAQGDFLTLGAFLGYTFYAIVGLPFIVALLLTIILMFSLGFGLEKGVIRVILNKSNNNVMYVLLSTIAIGYIVRNGAQFIWGSTQLNFPHVLENLHTVSLEGIGINLSVPFEKFLCIGVTAVIMVALHLFMKKTKFGTAMRAAALDVTAAKSCGINVSLTTGISWALSIAVAATGGILIGPIFGVYTELGNVIGQKGFSSAVLGGYGNMYGAIVGGIIVGLAETFIAGYLSSTYKDMFTYVMLLIFLFVKPTGIFNERAIEE